jgi:hypothetical protein
MPLDLRSRRHGESRALAVARRTAAEYRLGRAVDDEGDWRLATAGERPCGMSQGSSFRPMPFLSEIYSMRSGTQAAI